MVKRIDPKIHNNFLDANFWDKGGSVSEETASQKILELHGQGKICLTLPFSVKQEIEHPNTPSEIKRKAGDMNCTLPTTLTSGEKAIQKELIELLQGNAMPGKHNNDAIHLLEAEKYGGGYFITKDVRLLKKKKKVERRLAELRVVCPSEFMEYVRSGGV